MCKSSNSCSSFSVHLGFFVLNIKSLSFILIKYFRSDKKKCVKAFGGILGISVRSLFGHVPFKDLSVLEPHQTKT